MIKLKKYTLSVWLPLLFLIVNYPIISWATSTEEAYLNQLEQKAAANNVTNSILANTPNKLTHKPSTLLPGEYTSESLLPIPEQGLPPQFAANLFAGGYATERFDGLDEAYTIAAGDKVSIWMWGAYNQNEVLTVDNQGNLFVTSVGPINVLNVKASQLNQVVTAHIKKVYKHNVQIYVNLLTATPISVYVSGATIRPGKYAGMASDSVLYFLKQAGGIDSERGSYRTISILRKNKTIKTIDLYNFVIDGFMPKFNFKDNDVILVGEQSATVVVTGSVRNPFRFEFKTDNSNGAALAKYARPMAKVSHVGIIGDRTDGPFSIYLPYKDFLSFNLKDGDRLIFNDDIRAQVFDIQVSGSYLGPSYFAVKKNTHLHELLAHIPVDKSLTEFGAIYIERKSVALKQKKMLDDALDRLERSVLTAPVGSTGEASIRAQEAQIVLQFSQRARLIQPLGKVIVSDQGKIANVLLEQGDVIIIPPKSDLINIGGEVLMPQAVVYNKNATTNDYIAWAGGFAQRADADNILIIHPNGMLQKNITGPLNAGDQILVLPKVDAKNMQAVKDITQIIYQIAVAANVAVN